ncbi:MULTISPECIES: hypothetical protein [unclassified Micromonospora]|uniref:hypothetical protein n=1 Tax=unclassified Micromonospora TaxID=2617518 RepID=UPI0033308A17
MVSVVLTAGGAILIATMLRAARNRPGPASPRAVRERTAQHGGRDQADELSATTPTS